MSVNGESDSLMMMLIVCPKCGFSQPKDPYCAQCGIDISAYQVPEKSMLQKLSENLFVQLGIVILVGALAVWFVTKNQRQSFWTRVQFLRGSSSTQISQSKDTNQFTSNESEVSEPQNQESIRNKPFATLLSSTEQSEKKLMGPTAKIYYIEISQAILNKWLEEGALTRVETSYEVTIGYIPKLNQILEQYKSKIKILKEESYTYGLNQLYTAKLEKASDIPATSSAGRALATTENSSLEQTPVITTYATLDDDRNENLSGQLEVSLNPQTSFPAQFEMAADQSFFVSGFDKSSSNSTTTGDKAVPHEIVVILRFEK